MFQADAIAEINAMKIIAAAEIFMDTSVYYWSSPRGAGYRTWKIVLDHFNKWNANG